MCSSISPRAGEKSAADVIAKLKPLVQAYGKNWKVTPPPGKQKVGD